MPHNNARKPIAWLCDAAAAAASRDWIVFLLERAGYVVCMADEPAITRGAVNDQPDLVVVELGSESGAAAWCHRIRDEMNLAVPIIVLFNGGDGAPYSLLASGADHVLSSPIDPILLELKVHNCLRWVRVPRPPSAGKESRYLQAGDLRLDRLGLEVSVAGQSPRRLTPSEFRVIEHLMIRPGVVCSVEELLADALGYPPNVGGPDVLRTHICRLRRKIEKDSANPLIIQTVRGIGYRLVVST